MCNYDNRITVNEKTPCNSRDDLELELVQEAEAAYLAALDSNKKWSYAILTENLGTQSHEADEIPEEHRTRIYCSYDCKYQQELVASIGEIPNYNGRTTVTDPENYEYAVQVADEWYVTLSEWYAVYLNDEPLFDDEAVRELCGNAEDLVCYLGDNELQYCLTRI